MQNLIATASTTINAARSQVWEALVNPEMIKKYMFGALVITDWHEGSPITWQGEWQGKSYEDKGVILRFTPGQAIQYSHFSPLSGAQDIPENYHKVTIELSEIVDRQTKVVLTQDNNPTETARDHSQRNWEVMLASMKKVVEQ